MAAVEPLYERRAAGVGARHGSASPGSVARRVRASFRIVGIILDCSWGEDYGWYLRCVPEAFAPRCDDCEVATVGCPSEDWENALTGAVSGDPRWAPEIRTSVEDCLARVLAARAGCAQE